MDPRIDLREVKVKVAYVKLGEIDTIKEQYSVDVFVQARWREDSLKGKKASDVDFSKLWNPQIVLQNLVSHSKYKEWREIREGKDGTYVVERRRIKGVFSEHLELYDFPFDSQTIICTLSFATFAVSVKKPENRLQLGFTLTLTGVAFRFVTNQSLPKIPYLTQLDKYILFCMIFNFLVCVWHASVSKMTDSDEQLTADMWAFVAFIIVYCVFLAVFGTVVLIKWFLHHRRLQVMELEYQKKAAEILKDTWKLKGVTVIPPKTKVHPSD